MLKLRFFDDDKQPRILCLGAHADDIEIGCGGTVLRLTKEFPEAQVCWVVFSGDKKRAKEAYHSADVFLYDVVSKVIDVQQFRESYFPFILVSLEVKLWQNVSPKSSIMAKSISLLPLEFNIVILHNILELISPSNLAG